MLYACLCVRFVCCVFVLQYRPSVRDMGWLVALIFDFGHSCLLESLVLHGLDPTFLCAVWLGWQLMPLFRFGHERSFSLLTFCGQRIQL